MKKILFFIVFNATVAHAAGGHDQGGGGDLCEDRVKIIRDDIGSWIAKGGAKSLELPKGISSDQYSNQMLRMISQAKIKCVSSGDLGYPVMVLGTPKTCRFDKLEEISSITCDINKFKSETESDQYVLIHHEFAGLAGVEVPNGDDSEYFVSNQLTEYLVDQVVKKLALKIQTPTTSLEERYNLARLEEDRKRRVALLLIPGCNTQNLDLCSRFFAHTMVHSAVRIEDLRKSLQIKSIEIKSVTEAYVEYMDDSVEHVLLQQDFPGEFPF